MTQKTMVDQFNAMSVARKKAKENKPKGPVDLKELRRELHEANKKNRTP